MKPAVVGLAKVPELGPKLLRSSSNEVAGFILTVLHSLTYLPLVLLPIMQDAHLKLVVVLNTTLCLCLMAGNVLFHFLGIVKVFPKMLDTFLLALYASMVPVVYLQYSWLQDWVNVYHYGAVAAFVWLSILLPCWDSFATEGLKDRLAEALWELSAVRRAGLNISAVWGAVLTCCSIIALVPALLTPRSENLAAHIICDYVMIMLLLLVGMVVQLRTTKQVLTAYTEQPATDIELGDADVSVSVQHPVQPQDRRSTPPAQQGATDAPAGDDAMVSQQQDTAHAAAQDRASDAAKSSKSAHWAGDHGGAKSDACNNGGHAYLSLKHPMAVVA